MTEIVEIKELPSPNNLWTYKVEETLRYITYGSDEATVIRVQQLIFEACTPEQIHSDLFEDGEFIYPLFLGKVARYLVHLEKHNAIEKSKPWLMEYLRSHLLIDYDMDFNFIRPPTEILDFHIESWKSLNPAAIPPEEHTRILNRLLEQREMSDDTYRHRILSESFRKAKGATRR